MFKITKKENRVNGDKIHFWEGDILVTNMGDLLALSSGWGSYYFMNLSQAYNLFATDKRGKPIHLPSNGGVPQGIPIQEAGGLIVYNAIPSKDVTATIEY